MPGLLGRVHTHGSRRVHVHPLTSDEEGGRSHRGLLFHSAGGAVSATSLTLPTGETFSNGDLCPDGQPGRLRVVEADQLSFSPDPGISTEEGYLFALLRAKNAPVLSPEKYVFQKNKTVLIEFAAGPTSQ